MTYKGCEFLSATSVRQAMLFCSLRLAPPACLDSGTGRKEKARSDDSVRALCSGEKL